MMNEITARTHMINLPSGRFHYLSWNAERTDLGSVVLLHGITSSAQSWVRVGPQLAQRYQVYALDQRGHGDSVKPGRGGYNLRHTADDAIAFIDALGLDKFSTGGDFFGKTRHPDLKGVGKGVGCGANKEVGWHLDLFTTKELAFITHMPDGLNELHGIKIEYILGLRVITKALVVAGQAEHIVDAKRGGTQDIGLQGDPVSVSHYHLQDRFQTLQLQMDTGRQTAQSGDRGLIVGNIDGIDMIFYYVALGDDMGGITGTRRTTLTGNRHDATLKDFLKFTVGSGFHD